MEIMPTVATKCVFLTFYTESTFQRKLKKFRTWDFFFSGTEYKLKVVHFLFF